MMPSYAIGVDVGGTSIKAAVVSRDGRLVQLWRVPTPQGPDAVNEAIVALVRQVHAEVASGVVSDEPPVGEGGTVFPEDVAVPVGVDIPSVIDPRDGVARYSTNIGWRNTPLREILESQLERRVFVDHDNRTGAYAEMRWGTAEPTSIYLAVGTGISAIFLFHGEAVVADPWAGEVGQMPIPDPDGGPGNVLMERAASAAGMVARFQRLRPGVLPFRAGAKELHELVEDGDEVATEVWESGIRILAAEIARLTYFVGPIPVIVGGGLAQAGSAFFTPLGKALDELSLEKIPLRAASLGSHSQVLGAAARAFDLADA